MTKPTDPLLRQCELCNKFGFVTPRQDDILKQYLHNCYCPSCGSKEELEEYANPDEIWDKDPASDFWICYLTTPTAEY